MAVPTSRRRTVLLALVFAATTVFVEALPSGAPVPRPAPFEPTPARALGCASNPSFEGRLTASTSSTTAITRSTTGNVFGYISRVAATWSCTNAYRYSGLAWARDDPDLDGNFNWGNLINSTSVACNWVVDTDDYLKANTTSSCPASDAQYAMAIFLQNTSTAGDLLEAVWHNDTTPDEPGDFMFIHSDCTSYYGGQKIRFNQKWPSTEVTNRPGNNCDPRVIDSTNTSQAIVVDATAPAIAFDWPTAAGPTLIGAASVGVGFDATDAVAGFGGADGWTLTRQTATWSGSACGTFTNDTTTGSLVTGTTSALDQVVSQGLAANTCYRWRLDARDQNGNSATQKTSGVIRTDDLVAHLGQQGQHTFESWDLGGGDTLAVNVATGNLVVDHPIVSLPIRDGALDLTLTYNRHDPTSVGMGPGWRLNVHRRLAIAGDDVTVTAADGSRHTFSDPVGGTVKTYQTRPVTLYATLTRDTGVSPNRFTLTYRDQSRDVFEVLGSEAILVRDEDRHGNAVTLTYAGGTNRIATISDPIGRTISVSHDGSNRLSQIVDWANVSNGIVQEAGSGNRTHRFFYDGSGNLAGWSNPLDPSGTCPTAASNRTCITYPSDALEIAKSQTYTTIDGSPAALGTETRTVTTRVTFANAAVSLVRDAEETGPAGTVFGHAGPAEAEVIRRGSGTSQDTTTRYARLALADPHARIASVKRKLGAAWIERAIAYHGTYLIEPTQIVDDVGGLARTTEYEYLGSSLGLVARLTEPLDGTYARWTDYTYNANNDVTQVIVSRQGDATLRTTTRFCYTTSGCATSGTTLTRRATIEHYVDGTAGGANGQVEDVTTTYLYDTYGQRIRATRANYAPGGTLLDQVASGWTWDSSGNLTAEIANYANGTVTDPGDDITPNATTNARTDLTTAHTYDTAGNRISTADPRRAIEQAKGTTLGPDDYVSRWSYDPLGRRISETTPTTPGIAISQKTATTVYDEFDLARHVTDFGGLVRATLSDRAGRALATYEDPDGSGSTPAAQTSATTYDPQGRILTAKDRRQVAGTGGETQTTYDELGRTTSTKEAVVGGVPASVTAYGYDALDRRVTEETGAGTGTGQLTTSTYDLGGRTTKTDDEFTCAATTYDWRDLALTVSEGLDPGTCTGTAQRVITHAYDALGRRTSSTITAGEGLNDVLAASTYDAAGRQRTSSATKAGATTASTFTHNPLDGVVAEVRSDAGTAISWTKANADPAGNPTDRCVWNTDPGTEWCKPVGSGFTTAPAVHTTTGYDARNGRTSLRIPGAGETTYDPDHNYAVDLVYLPTRLNGSNQVIAEHRTDHAYDERHRLTSISHSVCPVTAGTHTCTATPVATGSVSYAYDDNDNRTRVNEANGAGSLDRHYCYDPLNRLVSARTATGCSTGLVETFEYDAAGNRTRASLSTPQYFRYSPAGQLCEQATSLAACPADPATWAIRYDDTGRTSLLAGWTLTYDGEGRLASACKVAGCATGDMVTMRYDASGRRVELVTRPNGGSPTPVTFRYQGDALAQELTGGSVTRTYVTDETGGIVKVCDPDCTGSNPQYLVTWNGHGDAQALWRINADGTLTLANSYTYGTWGSPTTSTHNGSADLGFRHLYVGRHGVAWDNALGLGLAYMGARHYSPALGRFLQPDPARAEANMYGYAENSPVTKVDPEGTAAVAVAVAAAWCLANFWTCSALVASGAIYVGTAAGWLINNPPRISICLWNCGPTDTVIRAQKDQKQLRSLREARRDLKRRLAQPGNERGRNHWRRQIDGIERTIRDILRRHPHWRVDGDP